MGEGTRLDPPHPRSSPTGVIPERCLILPICTEEMFVCACLSSSSLSSFSESGGSFKGENNQQPEWLAWGFLPPPPPIKLRGSAWPLCAAGPAPVLQVPLHSQQPEGPRARPALCLLTRPHFPVGLRRRKTLSPLMLTAAILHSGVSLRMARVQAS